MFHSVWGPGGAPQALKQGSFASAFEFHIVVKHWGLYTEELGKPVAEGYKKV